MLLDTSASKGQGYLAAAKKLIDALVLQLGADDRLALWTANVEAHKLTNGEFRAKNQLGDALAALKSEYPSGAVNLKKGLDDVIASFDGGVSRQRVLLFLGDGNSPAGPLDGDSRAALAAKMVQRQIAFFAVPLVPSLTTPTCMASSTPPAARSSASSRRTSPRTPSSVSSAPLRHRSCMSTRFSCPPR